MSFADSVKNNIPVWLLGIAVVAFGAGFGAYETIMRVSKTETISSSELAELRNDLDLARSELKNIRTQPNNTNVSNLYSMPSQQEDLSPGERWQARLACKDNDRELGIDFDTSGPLQISTFKEGSWHITFENTSQFQNLAMIQLWCESA